MKWSDYSSFRVAYDEARGSLQNFQRTEVDGRRVFCVGTGAATLIVPMLPALNPVYVPLMHALSATGSAWTFDPLVSASVAVSPASRASELCFLAQRLFPERCHLVAWSDTCAAASLAAASRPDLFLSVAFIGCPDRYRFPLSILMGLKLLKRFPLYRLPFVSRALLAQFGRLMGGPSIPPNWIVSVAGEIEGLPALFRHSCLPSLLDHCPPPSPLRIPSLVAGGDYDPVVTSAQSRAFSRSLGNLSRFTHISNLEHMSPFCQAKEVADAVLQFHAHSAIL